MAQSFSELWALVPKNKRTSKAKVVVALFVLGAIDAPTARATKDVTDLLTLHLKGRAPLNPSHSLTTAAPEVEPVLGQGDEKLWRITPTGVTWLASGAPPRSCSSMDTTPRRSAGRRSGSISRSDE